MIANLKTKLKRVLPSPIFKTMLFCVSKYRECKSWLYEGVLMVIHKYSHIFLVKRLQKKGKYKVVFFAVFGSAWKYDTLYRLMLVNSRFEPVILVCPVVNYGRIRMIEEMKNCCAVFDKKGYNYICAYNEENDSYVDVEKEIAPDIIFYTNPYEGLIDNRYFIKKFPNVLTCYVPYDYGTSNNYQVFHNLLLHNLVWRYYLPTEEHKKYSVENARNRGCNVVVTGSPGTDCFIDDKYVLKDIWKIKDRRVKRIVWAPHHSIGEKEMRHHSTFIKYCDYMLCLAEKYRGEIQIAFKPHPILKSKLYGIWGYEKTNEYYDRWAKLENGMLEEGDYIDLFLTSDAMIHDSGAFIIEYLYVRKPVARIQSSVKIFECSNPFTVNCLNQYYFLESESDIESFVCNVIKEKDEIKLQRDNHYKLNLLPPNGKLASENILDDLLMSLS